MNASEQWHLLFGMLALQNGLVTHEQLVAAFSVWTSNKSKSIDELLIGAGSLTTDAAGLLRQMVNLHAEKNAGDLTHSISMLPHADVHSVATMLVAAGNEDAANTITQFVSGSPSGSAVVKPGSGHTVPTHAGAGQASSSRSNGAKSATVRTSVVRPGSGHSQAAKSKSGSFSSRSGLATGKAGTVDDDEAARFRILKPLANGEGGMGVIHVAEDCELGRQVAIKRIRSDRASLTAYRQKFQLEAEITGNLEHPGIVPIYSLGTDPSGDPYYAMRLVKGRNLEDVIAEFHRRMEAKQVDFTSVEFRDLVERLIDVSQAIHYAHNRGVLHRDLKPGNVLVGEYGETLLIDWGLARHTQSAMASDGSMETLDRDAMSMLRIPSGSSLAPTMQGSIMGTLGYAPPEQVQGNIQEIGPRSDVYGLGAILYHLLTNERSITTRKRSVDEVIRDTVNGRIVPPVARNRAIPKSLSAVCMKAMAASPDDRYETAKDFLLELERWKADQPVLARRESWLETAGRLTRKHRSATLAAAVSLIAIAGVSVAATFAVSAQKNRAERLAKSEAVARAQATELAKEEAIQRQHAVDASHAAEQERDKAKQAEQAAVQAKLAAETARNEAVAAEARAKQAAEVALQEKLRADAAKANAEHAREQAETQRKVAEGVTRFLTHDLLGAASPFDTPDPNLRLKSVVDRASERIKHDLLKQADESGLVQASIQHTLGFVYLGLGEFELAKPHIDAAVNTRAAALGKDSIETMQSANNQAWLAIRQGDYGRAENRYRFILSVHQRDPQWESNRTALNAMSNLAQVFRLQNRLPEAKEMLEQSYQLRLKAFGDDDPDTLNSVNNLGEYYLFVKDYPLAEEYLNRAISGRAASLGPTEPETLTSKDNLARLYVDTNRLEPAEELFADVFEARVKRLGEFHPATFSALRSLANLEFLQEKYEDALPHMLAVASYRKQVQVESHDPETVIQDRILMNNLAMTCVKLGRYDDGEQFLTEALNDSELVVPADSEPAMTSKLILGTIHYFRATSNEDAKESIEEMTEAVKILEEVDRQRRLISPEQSVATLQTQYQLHLAKFWKHSMANNRADMLSAFEAIKKTYEAMCELPALGAAHSISRQVKKDIQSIEQNLLQKNNRT